MVGFRPVGGGPVVCMAVDAMRYAGLRNGLPTLPALVHLRRSGSRIELQRDRAAIGLLDPDSVQR
jgi:hypothetical protein